MSKLEQIIASGNRGSSYSNSTVRCADGFTISVIAGGGTYCSPRPALSGGALVRADGLLSKVDSDYPGPYTAVECGYPSSRPEPWVEWAEHFEDFGDTKPTEGVYAYVPVERVRALIEAHGGEAA